jgi:beta-lactamase regulating signal transducer with metallopeptidase domain
MSLLQEFLYWIAASAGVLALALLMCLVLHRSSATLRTRLLAVAFLIALALPLVMTRLPRPMRILQVEDAPPSLQAGAGGNGTRLLRHQAAGPSVADGTADRHSASPSHARLGILPILLATALAAIWLAVTLLGLHRLVRAHLRARQLVRAAMPIQNHGLLDLHTRLCREHGRHGPVPLLCSPELSGPLTVGLLRSHILLPRAAESWPIGKHVNEAAEAVLRHEITHAVRRDNLVNLVASLVTVLQWFDPLVWLALARLRREAELACDDAVLRGGVRPSVYARVLLSHARRPVADAGRLTIVPAVSFTCHAECRLRHVLAMKVNRNRPGRLATVALALLLMSATLPLTSLRPPMSVSAKDARAAGGPAAAARTPRTAGWMFLLPTSLKNEIATGLDEMAAELREARALNAWRENPALATPLPEGLTEVPAVGFSIETHDALALPGSKFGCIFASDEGYVRARWREGGATIHLAVEAVPHPEVSGFTLWLDSLAGLLGAGQDGEFRAYRVFRQHDGIRTSMEDRTRLEMQSAIAALLAHIQQTPGHDPARTRNRQGG